MVLSFTVTSSLIIVHGFLAWFSCFISSLHPYNIYVHITHHAVYTCSITVMWVCLLSIFVTYVAPLLHMLCYLVKECSAAACSCLVVSPFTTTTSGSSIVSQSEVAESSTPTLLSILSTTSKSGTPAGTWRQTLLFLISHLCHVLVHALYMVTSISHVMYYVNIQWLSNVQTYRYF